MPSCQPVTVKYISAPIIHWMPFILLHNTKVFSRDSYDVNFIVFYHSYERFFSQQNSMSY